MVYDSKSHAEKTMIEYGIIKDNEVYQAVSNGEVIESYYDDKPYPSVLIYGETKIGKPLHVVCAYNKADNLSIVVTVYRPNPNLWIDFKKRK